MKWRKLDTDPLTGITTYHAFDSLENKTHIKYEKSFAAIEKVLNVNKNDANDNKFKFLGEDDGDGLRHVARIDSMVIQQWLNEGVDVFDKNDWPEVKRRLNDSQWRFLRTSSETI